MVFLLYPPSARNILFKLNTIVCHVVVMLQPLKGKIKVIQKFKKMDSKHIFMNGIKYSLLRCLEMVL